MCCLTARLCLVPSDRGRCDIVLPPHLYNPTLFVDIPIKYHTKCRLHCGDFQPWQRIGQKQRATSQIWEFPVRLIAKRNIS